MTDNNFFEGMDSRVADIAKRIIGSHMLISLDASDIAKVTHDMDLVKGLSLECKGDDLGKVGASSFETLANVSGYQLKKLLLFVEQRGEYQLKMYQMQELVPTIPDHVDVIWGIGIDAEPSDTAQEIGLYYLAGYEKVGGVSRNAPQID